MWTDGGGFAMHHEKAVRRGAAFAALLALAVAQFPATTAASTPSSRSQSPSEAAPAGSLAWPQPYAGTQLTLETYASVPEFDFYATLMPDFEAKTGIHVNYIQQPVDAMDTKVPLQ